MSGPFNDNVNLDSPPQIPTDYNERTNTPGTLPSPPYVPVQGYTETAPPYQQSPSSYNEFQGNPNTNPYTLNDQPTEPNTAERRAPMPYNIISNTYPAPSRPLLSNAAPVQFPPYSPYMYMRNTPMRPEVGPYRGNIASAYSYSSNYPAPPSTAERRAPTNHGRYTPAVTYNFNSYPYAFQYQTYTDRGGK